MQKFKRGQIWLSAQVPMFLVVSSDELNKVGALIVAPINKGKEGSHDLGDGMYVSAEELTALKAVSLDAATYHSTLGVEEMKLVDQAICKALGMPGRATTTKKRWTPELTAEFAEDSEVMTQEGLAEKYNMTVNSVQQKQLQLARRNNPKRFRLDE